MATYLKRTSKLFDLSVSRNSADVSLRDLICPVCRGILIEPVSLPCTHNLCLRCLKGTFAHNSLSCPLCRIRVGSWLRTATKSETLVNNELWQLIRTRFPKEVESKYNGNDEDVVDESDDYTVPDRILSNAGDIRREYEAQLQLAQEELRRQREAERIASEALIRKLQAEEEQQLAQLAEDKLLAKSIAKKQYNENSKEALKYNSYGEYMKTHNTNSMCKDHKTSKEKKDDHVRHNSTQAISKPKDQFAISRTLNVNKEGCGAINMTTKSKRSSPEPGCSNNVKIYGLQSKEELHVPNDVINSKKKTLDVEVCITKIPSDDGRIGSAESGGSHDSINQEIHHFKPIKAMPRTPLLLSADGKQIDPKLIRVTAVIKKVMNVSLKPPSPTHSKRVIGCSWSAFKRQWKPKQQASGSLSKKSETEKPPNQPSKSKSLDDNRLTIDTNKNYTKKIINGARKLPKKLLSSPKFSYEEKPGKADKSKQKPKRRKAEPEVQKPLLFPDNVVENIAERIKRRKNVAPVAKRAAKSNAKKELQVENSEELEKDDSEDDIVKEQKRIEQQAQQEKQDFELAMRLQAQFNEMERVPVRTRRSKRAIESTVQSTDSEGDKSPLRKRKCRQARRNVV